MSINTKSIPIIAALVAAFALVSALVAGCSSGGDPASYEKNFEGTWDIVEMSSPDDGDMGDMLKALRDMGAELNIQFDIVEDGDNAISINIYSQSDDESLHGTWKAVDAKTAELTVEGESQNATIDGNRLVMEQDGTKMVCEKAGAEN